MSASRLARLIRALRAFHGEPAGPPFKDPYRLLLWEQVGYLADDEQRLRAFRALESRVGVAPGQILDAPAATLRAIARLGGAIAVNQRADRLRVIAVTVRARRSAMLVLQEHGRTVCRRTPRCGDCLVSGDCPSSQSI